MTRSTPILLAARAAGSAHVARGLPCQDAAGARFDGGRFFLALADGAGSAPRADEGSRVAVDAALGAAVARGADTPELELLLGAVLETARAALVEHVARPGAGESGELDELATTFLFALADDQRIGMVHVGDGWGVIENADGGFEVLSPPARGEYVNETVFLTRASYRKHARITVRPRDGARSIVLSSDGLETVLLDLARGEPHAPAFAGLLGFARGEGARADKERELAAFLVSERVRSRTDDDVSLAIAVLEREPTARGPGADPEATGEGS